MAKYTVTHSCGHTEEVQLLGSINDRERRIKWMESQECNECRKAKANAAAAAAAMGRGLAALTGSDKQVAWANTIREAAYKCLDAVATLATAEPAKAMVNAWRAKMDAQSEAKWWIDNRNDLPTDCNQTREALQQFDALFGHNL